MSADEDVVRSIAEVFNASRRPDQPAVAIDANTRLTGDLKLDSLAVMDFVMALEGRFDTVIPIDLLSDVQTVGDLARLLRPQPALAATLGAG